MSDLKSEFYLLLLAVNYSIEKGIRLKPIYNVIEEGMYALMKNASHVICLNSLVFWNHSLASLQRRLQFWFSSIILCWFPRWGWNLEGVQVYAALPF